MFQPEFYTGALLQVEETEEGQFTVEQVYKQLSPLPKAVRDSGDDRVDIDWAAGVVKVSGYIIKSTLEIGIEETLAGIRMPPMYGNIRDGINVSHNLLVMKGPTSYYLKNGNEVWVHVDVKVITSAMDKHIKLCTF